MRERSIANWAAGINALCLALLYGFRPTENSFFPRCPLERLTHLLCPSCGSTRALSALLHGQFAEAFHWNPLFVALLPALVFWAVAQYWSAVRHNRWIAWQVPAGATHWAMAAVLVFGLLRNLPGMRPF